MLAVRKPLRGRSLRLALQRWLGSAALALAAGALLALLGAFPASSMPWLSTIDSPKVTSSGSIRPTTGDMPRRSAACTDTWFKSTRCTR